MKTKPRRVQTWAAGVTRMLVLLLSLSASATPSSEQVLDSVVVVVNQEVITEGQIKNEIVDLQTFREMQRLQSGQAVEPVSDAELREQALQRLIERSMQLQFAKKAKISVSEQQVDATIDAIAGQNNMQRDEFVEAVESQGVSLEAYRSKIKRQLVERELKQKVIAPRVTLSDEEVQAALESPDNPLNTRVRYLVHDYLIEVVDTANPEAQTKARTTAAKVRTMVQKGHRPSFDDAEFLDLGWRYLHELPNAFAFIKLMQKGDVHTPIKTGNGYHVLHLVDVKKPYQQAKAKEYKLRHIMMKPTALLTDNLVKEQLGKIKKEIEQGTPFEKLARKYSEDYDTAHKGGDMGWQKSRALPAGFAKPLSNLKKGQVSEPFKNGPGWHLIYVEQVRESDDSQALLEQETRGWLFQQKVEEEAKTWLAQLRENTYIKFERPPS